MSSNRRDERMRERVVNMPTRARQASTKKGCEVKRKRRPRDEGEKKKETERQR